MPEKPPVQQVAFSPREFAALFKKEQSWGYRQIYAGKVTTITEYGRIMIPASEVERILASAARYEGGKQRPGRTKKEFQALASELQSAWQSFISQKRVGGKVKNKAEAPSPVPDQRKAALKRLFGSSGSGPAK